MREDPTAGGDFAVGTRLARDILAIADALTPAEAVDSILRRLFPGARIDVLARAASITPARHMLSAGAPPSEQPPDDALAHCVAFVAWLSGHGYAAIETHPLSDGSQHVGWLIVGRRSAEGDTPAQIFLPMVAEALRQRIAASARAAELESTRKQLADAEARLLLGARVQQHALLVAGAAHNLGNAMSVIVGYAELILQDVPLRARGDLQLLIRAARDSRAILFRALSRRMVGARQTASVTATINDSLTLTRSLLSDHEDIMIELLAEDTIYARIDPHELREVLINLILNAVAAMPEGGKLTLSSRAEAGFVYIDVRDTGVGIAYEAQVGIFEPLTTTRPSGSGLGLAVSRAIVERAGGSLTVVSEPGKGTVFTITLPVDPAAVRQ